MKRRDNIRLLERQVARINANYDLMPLPGSSHGAQRARDLAAMERGLPLVKQEILAVAAVVRHVLPCDDSRCECLLMAADSLLSKLRLTEEACCRQRGSGGGGGGDATAQSEKRRATAQGECILYDPVICETVLTALGHGYWGFIAPTSRMIRAVYLRVLAERALDRPYYPHFCATSAHAALHSPDTFRFALESGVCVAPFHWQVGATGSVEMVEIAVEAGIPLDLNFFLGASQACRVGLLQYIRACSAVALDRMDLVRMCCGAAAGGDSGPALVWISQQFTPRGSWPAWLRTALCHEAIAKCSMGTLKWLFGDGAVLFGELVDSADSDDDEEQVFQEIADSRSLVDHALADGAHDILQYLLAQGLAVTEASWYFAAVSGLAANLELLRVRGVTVDSDLVSKGLRDGGTTPEALQWLIGAGVWEWSSAAQRDGHLAFALQKCRGPEVEAAIAWMLSHGARWPRDLSQLVEEHALSGFEALRAVRLGCPFGSRWTSATCEKLLPSAHHIRKLHELGCPCACEQD
eukprot:TRINITY_DN11195_c0_g1_i1.p1 TRINITY_DN11195_c0_g1~~TRINITY_DN11195_c0_g1_i1.p1  ORF type:complete len:523 (-),score=117.19 TRINITY_DN11195_c0_g1_i1:38-1606(-)